MLNIFFDTMNIIGNMLYLLYDMLVLGGVFILFLFEDRKDKILLHKSYTKTCNAFCRDVCFDISWKMCEIVTIVQTSYRKTLVPNFHRITDNYFRNRNAVLLIKNGEEIEQFKTWQMFEKEKENIDFDLILYTKYNDTESKHNYTLIKDKCFSSPNIQPDSLLDHKSNVSFIIFQLTTDGNKYDIQLKESRNFFVKDNALKYPFFKWYMKHVYDVVLSEEFSVTYMTNDMSMATLHNPFFIKFNDDGVTSFSSGKPKIQTPIKLDESDVESEVESEVESDVSSSDTEYELEINRPSSVQDIMITERLKYHLD